MIGIYVHLPYCPTKCAYCDFNAYLVPSPDAFERYTRALLAEIDLVSREEGLDGAEVASVYFGGGTPSLFPASSLVSVLSSLRDHFRMDPAAEVTVEANPSGLSVSDLRAVRAAGANRLSIGAQTFSASLLRALGRDHGPEDIWRAVADARDAGFERVNVDVMFGLPGEDMATARETGRRAVALGTEHLSAYALELEPRTVFGRRAAKGQLSLPEEDDVVRAGDLLETIFTEAGFERYEVSNYARPGERSRHNLHTWRRGSYRGFGAGAHSFIGEHRFWNVRHPRRYEGLVAEGRIPLEGGEDVHDIARGEWAYLALRIFRLEGRRFFEAFGETLEAVFPHSLKWAEAEGWLLREGNDYVVARDRRWLLNSIAASFLDEGRTVRPTAERS